MSDINKFDNILSKIIKSEPGIKKVILADRTGLTIAHAAKFSYYPLDISGIGAIASAVFCASEEQGKSLEVGDLDIVTSEFREAKVFTASCGQGVLSVITDKDSAIGMIRLVMKSAAKELRITLSEFLGDNSFKDEVGLDTF